MRYGRNKRFWPAMIALCLGVFLVLLSLIVWTGYRDILNGAYDEDSIGSTYLTINKKISDENITKQVRNVFSTSEITALRSYPGVQDIGVFTSAQFPVEVSFADSAKTFSTNLFVEAIPKHFLDGDIKGWHWKYGNKIVPIILSREFLNLYNFGYAPNSGVPQLTEGTILALEFKLTIGSGRLKEHFRAKVVGFSNRISSILVPEGFVDYGNQIHGTEEEHKPTRVIIAVKDPTVPAFKTLFEHGDYQTHGELLRWNKLRSTMNAAVLGFALVSILLLILGAYVFILFIEMTIAAVASNIKKVLLLGYSPQFLSKYMFFRYGLIVIAAVSLSAVLAMVAQVRIAKYIVADNLFIAKFPTWEVWCAVSIITVLLLMLINRAVVYRINR